LKPQVRACAREDWQSAEIAGDVLSPVLVGLIYRDTFPLLNPVTKEPLWGDRAALLEQAMERRYNLMVTGKAETCPDNESARSGLCRHLGDRPDPAATGVWQPFLFVNGTSVATGQQSSQVKSLPLRAGPTARRACFRWPLIYAK
jgi:hypothetical protein